jgi:hypothetical protein
MDLAEQFYAAIVFFEKVSGSHAATKICVVMVV